MGRDRGHTAGFGDEPIPRSPVRRTIRLLDREHLRGATTRLLQQAVLSRGGSLLVTGDVGLGKTTALAEAVALAHGHFAVGRASGDTMEAWIPFGLITQALQNLGRRDFLSVHEAASAPASRAEKYYRALELLDDLGRPVLLALDDIHWADAESLRLLSFLCRRSSSMRLAVIATLRHWPRAAFDLGLRLVHDGHAQLERLAPLSEDGAGALLAQRVGREIPADAVRRVYASCNGNPLLLVHAAAAMAGGELDTGSLQPGPTPTRTALLLSRFAVLSSGARDYVRAASVLGTRFRCTVAAQVADFDAAAAAAALEALERNGLVRSTTRVFAEFVHPAFCEAVYTDLPNTTRARLHARAFAVLSRMGYEDEAAEHAVHGDLARDPAAVQTLRRVGATALRTGALSTANRYLQAALDISAGDAGPELFVELGEVRAESGELRAAATCFEHALDRVGDDRRTAARALGLLARVQALEGRIEEAVGSWHESIELNRADDPASAAASMLDHAQLLGAVNGPLDGLAAAEQARALTAAAPELQPRLAAVEGYMNLLLGDPRGLDAVALAASPGAAHERGPGRDALHWLAIGSILLERYSDAEGILVRAETSGQETAEVPGPWRAAVGLLAHLHLRRGRLEDALDCAERALGVAAGEPYANVVAQTALACALLLRDNAEGSERWCDVAEIAALEQRRWALILQVWNLRGRLCLLHGRFDDAADLYARLATTHRRLALGEPCTTLWQRHAIAAFLACRREDDAEAVLADLDAGARRLPCRWPRIAAAAGRAAVAELHGDHAGAEEHHRLALELHRDDVLPVEHVQTLLDFGSFLRRANQPVRARPFLAEAHLRAEATGALLLARRAYDELRVAGGRRHRSPVAAQLLTAQEERVGRLAATGHSNDEIAKRLSISVSTVKTHLERVYAKLGVRSRYELPGTPVAAHREVVAGADWSVPRK